MNNKNKLDEHINHLCETIEKFGSKVTFGLQDHHIKAIESELERFGNREIDAKYVKYIWEKLGKELSWEPFTLALYYFEYLEKSTHKETPETFTR